MAVDYSRIARDIAFTLEVKSEKIFENIFLNNAVLAVLGMQGRVKIVRGGNRFDERIHLGKNSNVGTRSKYSVIPTDFQNNFVTAYYGHAVTDGSAVVNLVEQDQNMGEAKLDNLAEKMIEECQLTFPNEIGDKLMSTSSGNDDPVSLVEELQATAVGSQTGTLGGINRADYPGTADPTARYQNQYNNDALADLGAAAGIAIASKFLWDCSPGGGALTEQPDLAITTSGVFAKATGGGDANRRYGVNDRLLKLGFNNLVINNAAFMVGRNAVSNAFLAINSNYVRLQVLAGQKTKVVGNVKTIGDGAQKVQLQICEPIQAYNYLNYAIKMYIVYNLTFGGLRQHGRKANITEA